MEIHRVTTLVLSKLPLDVSPLIKAFIHPTRLDWRTCKTPESYLIKRLQQVVTKSLVDPDPNDWIFDDFTVRELQTWTLCGVLYLIAWLNNGGFQRYGRLPRCRPHFNEYYADHYDKWYTQTFMCCV